jgi:3',5'-cyclic AMP phosphodiesterase CpdA
MLFLFFQKHRFRIAIAGCLLSVGLFFSSAALPASPEGEKKDIPSYAGFTGIDPARSHFALAGDTQSTSHWEFWRERNDPGRKRVIDEMVRRDPAFILLLGDLTVRGSSKKHWQNFDELNREGQEKGIPYFPVMGNHEFYGNDQTAFANYFERFPHLSRRRWYSFSWKNVGIIMVDSNFATFTKEEREAQSRWYLAELEAFEKKEGIDYVIVCCHASPFTNTRVVGPSEQSKTYFADPFIRFSKTSLFFSGHAHSYERFHIGGKFFVVSGGGGGPRHKVAVNPSERAHDDLYSGPAIRPLHFCEIERFQNTLIFRAIGLEADKTFKSIDSFSLSAPAR